MPGSPATPDHPPRRRVGYFLVGVLLGLSGGFLNGLLLANLPQIQGMLGLTSIEGAWLTAAYATTNVCMSLLLIKFRQQFGMQRFTRVILLGFLGLNLAQLAVQGFAFELLVRAAAGIVASGLSTLALFYLMQSLPAKARLVGLVLGVGVGQIALPLARAISPGLLAAGDVQNLFVFELGLTLVCLGSVALLRLPPSERTVVFEPLDLLTFALFAPGVALLAAVLSLGRVVWWTTSWLGYASAAAVVLLAAALIVEHNRASPMLNTRWLGSRDVLRFALVAAVMRVLLSEQSFGSAGLLAVVGMGPDQLVGFYAVVTLATVAGLAASVLTLNPTDLLRPVVLATLIIAAAAFLDADASNLTRPANLYVSQALIGFAAIYFLGPTMMVGILRALAKGPNYIVSFSAVFAISQTLGGLGGAALLGTLQIMRERFHSEVLTQAMTASNPLVGQRIRALSGAYARVVDDPAVAQAQGMALLGQQVAREANVLAFNDVFVVIGCLALLAAAWLGGRWIVLRQRGINPLANELAALARMREGAT